MKTVITQDKFPVGKVIHESSFVIEEERLNVRNLICKRVHQEVSLYNVSQPGYFQGLVQPEDAEATLNGYRLRNRREIDWKKQADLALQAFEGNGFFVLVDDRQVDDLDEVIQIKENTRITFMKLVPLVGG